MNTGISLAAQGRLMVQVCYGMAGLSLVGGVVGAATLGGVEVPRTYGLPGFVYSPALVIAWLAGGVFSAVLWWVLSGIGLMLQSGSTAVELSTQDSPKETSTPLHSAASPEATKLKTTTVVAYGILTLLGVGLIAYLMMMKGTPGFGL